MASYGERLNNGYEPIRDNIYPLFVEYFENPKMTKVKDVGNYSMYIVKIASNLGIEYRYLIVFVIKNDFKLGDNKFLSQLEWQSLQTRTLPDEHHVYTHSYSPVRIPELDKKITLEKNDNEQYIYGVDDLPIRITLLPKKGNQSFYNNKGTVVIALETYQTLVNFTV